ncbi:Fc receptor-like protein 5 [Enoplosus armatus]|uniref:Fc receptor-like protein 5 n=1 Tax=Enoplosus armatus TaxID=215367 RepID=UPI003994507F
MTVTDAPKPPSASVSPSAEIVEGSLVTLGCGCNFLIDSRVTAVQSQNGWGVTYSSTQICAFKGSTVDMHCTYTHPPRINGLDVKVEERFWFKGDAFVDLETISKYSGRVEHICEENGCTLRITDLRESDSGLYRFRFITNHPSGRYAGKPGVMLSVTDPDLQVQVRRPDSVLFPSRAELKCHSSCPAGHSSYIWYKNGQKIKEDTSPTYADDIYYSNDSYSCAVKGNEDFPSPSVCVHDQTCNRVTYDERSICAFKGSSVNISCSYNSSENYVESKFWFSPERSDEWQNHSQPEDLSEDCQYAGRVQVLEAEGGRSTLRVTDLRESDSAEYRFKFTAGSFEWGSSLRGTALTVAALQVQLTKITVSQPHIEAELKCHSRCSPDGLLSYVWFKNGQKVPEETSSYTVQLDPRDNVSCALKGHADYRSPLLYAPKPPSASVSPSGEIVEGRSVNLTCSSDANPAAKYTWYKENQTLPNKDPQLVFSSIRSSDSGEYYCAAENELGRRTSENVSINVKYAPKPPSVSVSPSGEIVEGSSVTLTCSSDANPAANYTWYKENQTLPHGPGGIYDFTSVSSEDRGTYHCKSENQYGQINSSPQHINVQYAPKPPSVSVSPSAETVEDSSVTLTCSSDANPAANYTWYKENQTLLQGPEGKYYFTSISHQDSGYYNCKSENQYGQMNSSSLFIDVQYPPKPPSVSVSPSAETVEDSSVTLTCSSDANPAANYTWYKENEDSPKASGQIFTITDIRAEHSGSYYCEAQNSRGRHSSTLYLKQPAEQEDFFIHYASVNFTKKQEDPLGSNVRPARKKAEEVDSVVYATVKFNSGSTASVLQGQNDWGVTYISTEMCALKGSTVEISCSYIYPPRVNGLPTIVEKTFWFNGNEFVDLRTDPEYSGRVQYLCDVSRCTLRITDLRESDSAEYRFRFITNQPDGAYFGSPGVTLTVTGLQVQVSRLGVYQSYNWAELKCHGKCHLPGYLQYVWYKNKWNLGGRTTDRYSDYFGSADSFSCAVRGYEKLRSPAVYAPKPPSVSVSPSAEIVEDSSVTLSCSSDANPAAKYTWYKKNQTLPNKEPQLVFSSIRSSDSGEYYCAAENELGRTIKLISISVEYPPKPPSVSVSPSAEIVEGSSVNLSCSSDANPAANYTWYKENEDSPKASGQNFSITDIRAEHSGSYYCEAQNRRGRHSSTLHLIDVAGTDKLIAAGTITVVLLAIIFLSVFLCIRKKRTSKESSEAEERPDNMELGQAEEQDNLQYASIHISNIQADPLYCNIRPAQPLRHVEQQEVIEYVAVKFNSGSTAQRTRETGVNTT